MTSHIHKMILQATFAGLLTEAEAEEQLDSIQVRGGFKQCHGKIISYTGYNYATQKWVGDLSPEVSHMRLDK